jgi:integrase
MPRPLDHEQLAAALYWEKDRSVRLMILLGAYAGLRVSEIANLQTADIHLHTNPATLMVRQGKGRKDRVVPLHPVLAAEFGQVPAGWVFPSPRKDGPMSVEWVRDLIERPFAALGVEMTPHTLRHTFGTAVAQGTDGNIMAVAELMGHSSVTTSQGYVGWSPTETARRAVAGLYEVEGVG